MASDAERRCPTCDELPTHWRHISPGAWAAGERHVYGVEGHVPPGWTAVAERIQGTTYGTQGRVADGG